MNDPRARTTLIRYMAALQAIQALEMRGFARMLDTATEEQMTEHDLVLGMLEAELLRAQALGPGES